MGQSPEYLFGRVKFTTLASLSIYENKSRIKLSDLINKSAVRSVILSSYKWDDEWLLDHLPAGIPIVMIRTDLPNDVTSNMYAKRYGLNATYIFARPPIERFGVMHTKLIIANYDGFIRLVITSANLLENNWRDVENVLYVQDFPNTVSRPGPLGPSWFAQLTDMLVGMKVPRSILAEMFNKIDESLRPRNAALVMSLNDAVRTNEKMGVYSLARALGRIGFMAKNDYHACDFEITTSSLGKMDSAYLSTFSRILRSVNGVPEGDYPRQKDNFFVLFPEHQTVANSYGGQVAGQHIHVTRENWLNFPRGVLHKVEPKNHNHVMHSKIIIGHSKDDESKKFYYLGSHNFTKAAWGYHYSRGGDFALCNYELGIVFAIDDETQLCPTMFPVPFKEAYMGFQEEDEPWIFTESQVYSQIMQQYASEKF